ncbi:unnamed protein product [Paramecium primaurelia]|uniref:WD40-repeat-containing domain n=1 Tax=Paramecium primaurelia TaxID=5886 RepID=A0A8S1QQK6_PARPR|nr:unnamed protein product [Paramecium primaurelia]
MFFSNQENTQSNKQNVPLTNKSFNYQLIKNNSVKQDQICYAIAINKDVSIVLVACSKDIKVFEFQKEVLKQTQLLIDHQDYVNTLNFMNKSNRFISGSSDKQIIIWVQNQNNQWVFQEKLTGHTNQIRCLVLNNNDDQIISGSSDNTIKFWMKKQNEWFCSQTIAEHTQQLLALSLNDQQNKVISCGLDAQILIIKQSQQDSKWMIIQKIKVEQYGCRICFIDENIFTFQPFGEYQMHIYEMNNTNEQYSKVKHIDLKGGYDQCYFPQQYVKSKCILVNENKSCVYLIKKIGDCEFKIEQSIQFKDYSQIYGQMSDDGQYLIIWDEGSKEIQIRKYNEI